MPECIVCKGHYETGKRCERCHSSNEPWDNWQTTHIEEQGKTEGLLAFYAPWLYLPLFTVVLAIAFGLMGVGGLWRGITRGAQLLALVVTVCGCLITALAGYSARHDIREQELLNRVQRGYAAILGSIRLRAMVLPAFSIFLVFLVAYAMVTSDLLWDLAKSFLLDPSYLQQVEQQEAISDVPSEGERLEADGLRTRIRQIIPLTLMAMYIAFLVSLNYGISLQLACVYAQEMNRTVPKPIFLQEDKLAELVRRQAELVLSRPIPSTETSDDEEPSKTEQGPRSWTWDEMERTHSGGVKLTAMTEWEYSRVEQSAVGDKTKYPELVSYEVEADPWGHIISITRRERIAQY